MVRPDPFGAARAGAQSRDSRLDLEAAQMLVVLALEIRLLDVAVEAAAIAEVQPLGLVPVFGAVGRTLARMVLHLQQAERLISEDPVGIVALRADQVPEVGRIALEIAAGGSADAGGGGAAADHLADIIVLKSQI